MGKSLGVRIPKTIINQVGFRENTNLVFKVTDKGLLISPNRQNRQGWNEIFKTTSSRQKEQLIISEEIVNQFEKDEWQW